MNNHYTFELQVMREGRWTSSGIYEDKVDAVRDARIAARRYLGVRVIQDHFDEARNQFVARTVYRHHGVEPDESPAIPRPESVSGPVMAAEMPTDSVIDHFAAVMLVGATVVLAGIGGLFWAGMV